MGIMLWGGEMDFEAGKRCGARRGEDRLATGDYDEMRLVANLVWRAGVGCLSEKLQNKSSWVGMV
jgi:hypothetical protein